MTKMINSMENKKVSNKFGLSGKVKIELRDEKGNLKELREFKNTFMNTGDAHVADQLAASPGEDGMGWMAVGTSSTAKAVANTTLNSEIDRNALTAGYPEQQAAGDDNDVKYKASWAAGDGTGAITEAGIFNSSSAGSMLCASTFSVVNKGASDTLEILWTVSCGSS